MAPLTHIVIFGFKDDVSKATRNEVGERFHALAKESTRGADSKPYILSIRGGKDASIERMTQGYEVRSGDSRRLTFAQQVWVIEFASAEDRDYYIHDCKVHAVRGHRRRGH